MATKAVKLFACILLFVMVSLSGSCSSRDNIIPQIQPDGRKLCIDLNNPGIEANTALIQEAIEDSQRGKKPIRFYKALRSANSFETFYVYFIENTDDIYMVYVSDTSQKSLLRKFWYGSLHHPCKV